MSARKKGPSKVDATARPVPPRLIGNVQVRATSMRESARIGHVMAMAAQIGLTSNKDGRISGRVSPELIERAKEQTGLKSDTDLIEFALANVALEDRFWEAFDAVEGTVDPDLDLEF